MQINTYHKRACNLRALCKLLILPGLSGLSETQSWRKAISSCGGHRNLSFESTLCLLSNLVSAFPHSLVLAGADAASMFPPYTSYGGLFTPQVPLPESSCIYQDLLCSILGLFGTFSYLLSTSIIVQLCRKSSGRSLYQTCLLSQNLSPFLW